MAKKRLTGEQIVAKLRQGEVLLRGLGSAHD